MIYEEVFREFELQGVQYLLVGGVAVNIYGYVRMTMDLDIMVDLSEDNLSRIIGVMEKLGFSPRVPVDPHDLRRPVRRHAGGLVRRRPGRAGHDIPEPRAVRVGQSRVHGLRARGHPETRRAGNRRPVWLSSGAGASRHPAPIT